MVKRSIPALGDFSPENIYKLSYAAIAAAIAVGVISFSGAIATPAMGGGSDYPTIQQDVLHYGERVWDDPESENDCPEFAICAT
ncbi:hypothetical protein ACFWVM_19005 [Nocardia fluminea]|uniref:hypothetical protein n=1 Tax=Nocardia fluminea TaxID=134984 RepID=UPI0036569B42